MAKMFHGLRRPSLACQRQAERIPGFGEVGPELHGPRQAGCRVGDLSLQPVGFAQVVVRLGKVRLKADRPAPGRDRLTCFSLGCQGASEPVVGRGAIRLELHGLSMPGGCFDEPAAPLTNTAQQVHRRRVAGFRVEDLAGDLLRLLQLPRPPMLPAGA